MMESANSHHRQLQDQFVGSSSSSSASSSSSSSSSSLATAPCYGAWNPTPFLNTTGFSNPYTNTDHAILNSRETSYTSMAADLGFHWANSPPNFTFPNQSTQDLQLSSRIKEQFSDHYLRKYNELLSSSSSSSSNTNESGLITSSERRNLQQHGDDLGTKLLLKSFSSGNLMNNLYPNDGTADSGRLGLTHILPSINISNLNQMGLANPAGSLDMNLEALDLLASSRFSGNFGPSHPQNQIGLRDGFPNFGFDLMQQQQSHQVPLFTSNKVSSPSSNGSVSETKRTCKMEPKAPLQNAPKKSRLESRATCPPFKVRKEKLGDRIAALQQLVAPFGKTDTASVLMEAIGYIKFLQNQVETLSVPYMKASRNKPSRPNIKGGGVGEMEKHQEEAAGMRDLKSRGLCLVPLSCLSYITDGGGGVVWPPPHFGGAA